ncbi:MAG: hypothetical protein JW891_07050 [Candidatus Lokiarchaeota archaeon]|nr:hypothetical protein [Candidatus Lokiarchaeota archaeon]
MDSKKFNIIYLVGLLVTTILMFLIIIFWIRITAFSFLIFFWILKFLSGFGLILGIAGAFLFLLNKGKEKIGKKGTKAILIFQIIVPFILIIYALYNIISSAIGKSASFGNSSQWSWVYVLINNIIYLYGIVSLLINLYIWPIAKGKFREAAEIGKTQWAKKGLKQFGRNVKKKVFQARDEHAKVMVQDQKTTKEFLNLWRNKFAINALLVFSLGTFIFTPMTFIYVMYWLRVYIFFRMEEKKYERVAMLISMIVVGIIACVLPFVNFVIYQEINDYMWTINIFYLVGILIASWIFIKKLLNLKNISISGIKEKKKEEKIEEQAKKIKDLESKLKEKPPNKD